MTTTTISQVSAPAGALDCYLRMLAGSQPGARLLEIRFTLRHRDMGRVFIAAHSAVGAGRFIRRLAAQTNVYIGVALRNRRSGGRGAIDRSHLMFIEVDSPDGERRLKASRLPPTMLIASGTPGHVHAYWQLHTPVGILELERANRRLAHHLGGDLASVDAARILRPPASLNHKHRPPAPVELLELRPARRYELAELVDELPDPQGKPRLGPVAQARSGRHPLDVVLLTVPSADYVRTLAGREPNHAGKVRCPFHDDTDPSLQLYQDGSWYCFGCRIGGTIYDFAAQLWGQRTKGSAFLKLRARLAADFGVDADT